MSRAILSCVMFISIMTIAFVANVIPGSASDNKFKLMDPRAPEAPDLKDVVNYSRNQDGDVIRLWLYDTGSKQITDERAKSIDLASHRKLDGVIILLSRKLTDEGLAALAKTPTIKMFHFTGTEFSDKGIAAFIQKHPELEFLGMHQSKLTDKSLEAVSQLRNLDNLRLCDSKGFTDAGMKCISNMDSVRSLALTGTRVTDAGMKDVAKLKNLLTLSLDETSIGDKGLFHLKDAESLMDVYITKSQVSEAGIAALQEVRPTLHIHAK
jgi:hypothetical protein